MKYSYSMLSDYDTCPARYKAVRIDRTFKNVPGPEADWGSAVHEAVEGRMQSPTFEMPEGMAKYAAPADSIRGFLKGFDLYTEVSLGIDKHLQPTDYKEAHLRGKIDLLAIRGPRAYVIDWKTGKVRENFEQLRLYSLLAMLNHPMVQKVTAIFVWLKHKRTTRADYTHEDTLGFATHFLDKIKTIEDDTKFTPTPSGLCKAWCPVLTCAHNGRRSIF